MVLARRDTGRGAGLLRPAAVVAAVVPAFLCAMPARALELPAATGVGVFETREPSDKRLSVSASYAFGKDSNYKLQPTGEETDQTFYEGAAGLVLNGGNALWNMRLSYQARHDRYPDAGRSFFRENQAALTVGKYTEKLQFGLRAKYAAREDPVDIEDLRSFGRTQVAYAPQIAFCSGRTEVGLGYRANTLRYDEFPNLEHDENTFTAEVRWWMAENKQVFFRRDAGSVDYLEGGEHLDFKYKRLYGGYRLDVAERAGLDVGVGYQELSDFDGRPDISPGSLFAVARVGLIGSRGTSRLELAYGMSDEQSATSAYKSVRTVELRYRRQANRRINWAAAVRRETADFEVPIEPVSSLSRMMADAEINVDVGSLSGCHGRIFAKVEYESRDGDSTAYRYARLRILGGFAVVF